MLVVGSTREGGRQMRRHHEAHIARHLRDTRAMPSILAIELIQRNIADPTLEPLASLVLLLRRKLATQGAQAVVELVHLAAPGNLCVRTSALQLLRRLQRPRPGSVQRIYGHQAVHERQAQSQEHSLKDRVVAVAERAGIKLLQTLAQKIDGLPLARMLADFVDRVTQDLTQLLGTFRRLCGILTYVLHDRP